MRTSGAGASALAAYRGARNRRRALWLVVGVLAGVGVAFQLVPLAVPVALLVGWLAATRKGDIDRWRRGAAAEQATAWELARLPVRRWSVWHDVRVPGSRANLDHVVIGPTGVWVVDTKSTRLAVTARWHKVWFGERELDTSAARWEAEVVGDRLDVKVQPLIVVHGGGLRRRGGRAGGVRVVPASRLRRHIKRGRRRLDRRGVLEFSERFASTFEAYD